MDVETEKNDTEKKNVRRSSSAAQIIIFVNGVLLTFLIFGFLSVFTDEIIRDEQANIADNAIQSFISRTDDLGNVINQAAILAQMESDNTLIQKEIAKMPLYDEGFLQILLLRRQEGGGWTYELLMSKLDPETRKTLEFLSTGNRLVNGIATHLEQTKVNSRNIFLFHTGTPQGEQQAHFIGRQIGDNPEAGYVVGLLSMPVFDGGFGTTAKKYLAGFLFWNADTGTEIWGASFNVNAQAGEEEGKRFLLDIWQIPAEIRLQFNAQHKLFFLKNVPTFFAIIGGMLTLVATFYMRNNKIQAQRMAAMNTQLENKNTELMSEVSERERLNKILRQSEKENRAIIDAVSDIIFETNIEGQILFLSAAWRKVTGFDPEQFIGNDLFSLLHPQDQKSQQKDFGLLIKGQKQAYRSFTRLRTADGTFRAVEIAMSMIRQDQNRNLRVVGTFTDVEERRRAERALGEAEKKYRTIVENAAGGIYQLTPEGLYLSANPAMARILGYSSPEQILREVKNAYETVYDDVRARQDIVETLANQADFYNHETQIKRRDGRTVWVNENIRAVKDENGNILYFEGSIEDITQRKEYEIDLMKAKMESDLANRAKSEFLANMSHELRTPLNSIIGFSEIIKNQIFGPIEQKSYWEYAKHINESGQNLLKVINEILDISRIEAGDRQLNEGVVDLERIVGECLDLLSNKIENNQMNILNSMQRVPKVVGEELAIKQIFMNLLSNAIKFTPGGGSITLSYEVDPHGQLHISVTDTGIGLDDKEIEKALSPFGQIDNELNRSGSGTGLGLTLVSALTKLHRGRFDLFSQKGIGTTATIVFPVDRVSMTRDEDEMPPRHNTQQPENASEEVQNDTHDEPWKNL